MSDLDNTPSKLAPLYALPSCETRWLILFPTQPTTCSSHCGAGLCDKSWTLWPSGKDRANETTDRTSCCTSAACSVRYTSPKLVNMLRPALTTSRLRLILPRHACSRSFWDDCVGLDESTLPLRMLTNWLSYQSLFSHRTGLHWTTS